MCAPSTPPDELGAYQQLRIAVGQLGTLAQFVAEAFGTWGAWPMVTEAVAGQTRYSDLQLFCTAGDPVGNTVIFREIPDSTAAPVNRSPWLRVQPKLNSVAEVREVARQYAESHAAAHASTTRRLDAEG
jgi:hypothetical protein